MIKTYLLITLGGVIGSLLSMLINYEIGAGLLFCFIIYFFVGLSLDSLNNSKRI